MNIVNFRKPGKNLWTLSDEFRTLFGDDFFSESYKVPAIDMAETDEGYELACEVPGLSETDVDVQVADDVLTITGERKEESDDSEKQWYRKERRTGNFQRRIVLPSSVDAEKIKGTLENGILSLFLPKKEALKPRKVELLHR